MRIVLFGDGRWATDSMARLTEEGHEIAGAVARSTPSDYNFLGACTGLGIPVIQPKKVNSKATLSWLSEHQPELCLSIAYNQILKQPILDIPGQGFVNFHAGKLPNYRGRNIINWAIINGESEIGITAHYVDQGIDTGDIIVQECLPIGWTETYGVVLDNIVTALPNLVVKAVGMVSSGNITVTPQSHLTGTYFGGRRPGDEWLDWSDTSVNLHNKIRAITRPGPGATTVLEDRKLIVWQAFCDITWPRYLATPGQVVGRRDGEGVLVKTGDSTLLVQEIQSPGEEPLIPDWPIGTRLGVNLHSQVESMQDMINELKATANRLGEESSTSPKGGV